MTKQTTVSIGSCSDCLLRSGNWCHHPFSREKSLQLLYVTNVPIDERHEECPLTKSSLYITTTERADSTKKRKEREERLMKRLEAYCNLPPNESEM